MQPAISFQETVKKRCWLEAELHSDLESGKAACDLEWKGDWTLKSTPASVFIHVSYLSA